MPFGFRRPYLTLLTSFVLAAIYKAWQGRWWYEVAKCLNCGEKGHTAQKCPHARNQELYNKNRKAFYGKKRSAGNNCNGGGRDSGNGKGKGKGNPGYNQKAIGRLSWLEMGLNLILMEF